MSINLKIIIAGLLFIFSIITGIWLSKLGRPLNTMLSAFHKLLALASLVFLIIVIYSLFKTIDIKALYLILAIFTGLCFILLFVTGVLLSIEKETKKIVLIFHLILTLLTLISSIVTVVIMVKKI